MHLVRVRESGEWFITAVVYPPGDIGGPIDTFSIQEGYGLWAGELANSLEISIGGRKVSRKEGLAFTRSPGFSVSGRTRNTLDARLIPLSSIVDWIKTNIASPTYIPFPPITFSS